MFFRVLHACGQEVDPEHGCGCHSIVRESFHSSTLPSLRSIGKVVIHRTNWPAAVDKKRSDEALLRSIDPGRGHPPHLVQQSQHMMLMPIVCSKSAYRDMLLQVDSQVQVCMISSVRNRKSGCNGKQAPMLPSTDPFNSCLVEPLIRLPSACHFHVENSRMDVRLMMHTAGLAGGRERRGRLLAGSGAVCRSCV